MKRPEKNTEATAQVYEMYRGHGGMPEIRNWESGATHG